MEKNMPNHAEVTILVNSCDQYASVWYPFFKLFSIQWPGCPYEFVLNTESKNFEFDELKVRCVHPSKTSVTWSRRFRHAIEQVNTKYVVFFLEDYFLLNPVNQEGFNRAVALLDEHDEVGMVNLCQTNREDIATPDIETDYFYSRKIDEQCLIWCRANLWRKEYLLQLLRDHETIWEFESYALYRAMKLKTVICQQNNAYPEIFDYHVSVKYGHGITGRKWLPNNRELFARYGIQVDFDELGFGEIPTEKGGEPSTEQDVPQTTQPLSCMDKIRECGYRTRQAIKHKRKRLRRKWRAYRSMR